jgi:hypothetical protein
LRTVIELKRSEAKTLKSNERPRLVPPSVGAAGGRQSFHAVDADAGELRTQAAHRDLTAFAAVTRQGHARDALDGFREVEVGELADVLGQDRVDGRGFDRLTFRALSRLERKPVTTTSVTALSSAGAAGAACWADAAPARLKPTAMAETLASHCWRSLVRIFPPLSGLPVDDVLGPGAESA